MCHVFALILSHGVDYHVNTALLDQLDNIGTALVHLAYNLCINAHLLNSLGTAGGSHQLEAQLGEGLGQLLHFLLVLVSYGKEDAAIQRNVHAGTGDSLVQSTGIMIVDAHNLAGGLHLRAKGNIHVSHLVEGEYRCLDSHIRLRRNQPGLVAQLLQGSPQCHLGSHIHHLHISYLAEERHSTGGTRIYLDNVNLIISHNILDVHEALDMEPHGQTLGIVNDGVDNLGRKSLRRIYSNRVAGMNTGTLNVLHDTRNHHINAVRDGVNLHLCTLHVAVNQHRMLRRNLHGTAHVVTQLIFIVNNFHGTAAQYIGRAHHNRIADISSPGNGILLIGNGNAPRTRNIGLGQHLVKTLPVLGTVNVINGSAKYLDACLGKSLRQIDGSLAAKLNNNPLRLFLVDDIQHILGSQRLKIQPVGNIEVCGNSLRVVVDNNRLNAHLAQCPHGMYGAVVKLHALADADRAGTQYHHLAFLAGSINLILLGMEGGVIRRGCRLELCRAGINHLVAWQDVHGFP